MLKYCDFYSTLISKEIAMNCVYYNDLKPNGFEELFSFSRQAPYSLHIKKFVYEDIVPLHYAKTIEILLCDRLEGRLIIDGNPYPLQGRQLFVIPPYTLHSCFFSVCPGSLYVLKISLPEMDYYCNLRHYLEACGCGLQYLNFASSAQDGAWRVFSALISRDGDLPYCLGQLMELCRLLAIHHTAKPLDQSPVSKHTLDPLKELIQWTQENFARKITLQEAAAKAGYSKYHFCNLFKTLTGSTYLQYLNTVRISHACFLLCQGIPMQDVSNACGFENLSYFIQVFKRVLHTTPGQYLSRYKEN